MSSMLPCPFCGHLPGWQEPSAGRPALRQLLCKNPDCKLDVRTRRAGTDEELVANWNSRVDQTAAAVSEKVRIHLRTILTRAREAAVRDAQPKT
jgi:hypothetical protein